MRVQTIRCDGCGCEITGNPYSVNAEELDRETGDLIIERMAPELSGKDFCQKCIKKIINFAMDLNPAQIEEVPIGEVILTPEQKEEIPPEQKEEPKRRKIDRGKMVALHNAGWTPKAIAEEMGLEPKVVSQTLYLIKKGEKG